MALRRSYLTMHRQADAVLSEFDLTANQFVILSLLDERDGVPQRDLVERASSDPNTIRPMLKSLESKGLVSRLADPHDGRAWQVEITDSGRKAYREIRQKTEHFRKELVSVFDRRELDLLMELLNRVAEAPFAPI